MIDDLDSHGDDEFVARLTAHDDALRAQRSTDLAEETASLPAGLRARLDEYGAWCAFVRTAWNTLDDATAAAEGALSLAGGSLPKRFGRFEIRRELGRGAYGVVFLAYDPRLRRQVALKVPRPEVMVTAEMRRRFEREARAAAVLDHPNLVPVFEAGEEQSISFIASAYCPGPTLADWLKARTQSVPPRLAAQIVARLARAIAHAHARGVLHRDLKPGNIILEPLPRGPAAGDRAPGLDFIPRVTDFGLARMSALGPEATTATQSGEILGTPSYMSPEQADGRLEAIGPPTDVYGLGAILYTLLTGRPPFQADSPLSTLVLLRTAVPVAPSRIRPRMPRDLETVCLKCLDKRPQKRYASAEALADDLDRYVAGEPVVARRVSRLTRFALWCRREPVLAGTVAAAIAAVGAVASVGFWQVVRERDRYHRERDRSEARRGEAVANLHKARDAVDRMLTRVSEKDLKDIPRVQSVQRALLEDALEFYRDFARHAGDDPELLLEVARSYRRVGESYEMIGWKDKHEQCCAEALAILNRLAASFPAVPVYRAEIARVEHDLCAVWHETGRLDKALEVLPRTLASLEQLAQSHPAEPAYQSDQAKIQNRYGMALAQANRHAESAAAFGRAVDLLDDLAKQFPREDYAGRAALNRSNFAAELMMQGRLADAERILCTALEFWEKLAQRDPAGSNARSKTALTLEMLANVFDRAGRNRDMEPVLRRAVDLRRALSKDYPDTVWYHGQLASDLGVLARLAGDRGDQAEARRLAEQAVASRDAARKLAPTNAEILKSARETRIALIEILLKLRDQAAAAKAIAELLALAPGLDGADPALDALRARGDFQELFARSRAAAAGAAGTKQAQP